MSRNAATPVTGQQVARPRGRGGRPAILSRERILDVARQIPARELTMPMVARRLDVSAAALYRHFDSRDALLAALGAELAASFQWPAANAAAWREWLLDTTTALFRFFLDNPVILAVPDWTLVAGMAPRLLDAAHDTLEGAGFDSVNAVQIWGVVSGHAYLGARLLHDAPAQNDAAAVRAARDAIRSGAGGTSPRWLAAVESAASSDPREQLVQSLRWLVAILPEPDRAATDALPKAGRKLERKRRSQP